MKTGEIFEIRVNSTVADSGDRQLLTQEQYAFMMDAQEDAMSETQKSFKAAVASNSVGNPVIDKDGNVKITWDEIEKIKDGN